jgi:phosphoglycerate dehydrogenase-like enzyme
VVAPLPDRIVVAVPATLASDFQDEIRATSPRIDLVLIPNDAPTPELAAEASVFYRSWAMRRVAVDGVIERASGLRWMHVPSAGVDLTLTPNVMERDFVITHMPGVFDEPVAEFALGLMLAAAKRLPAYLQAQQRGEWLRAATWDDVHRETTMPVLLRGATLGIVGFGGIGRALAEMARPLKMRVLGYRREPRPDSLADAMYGPGQLGEVLAASDYVVLAVPLTPETQRMIGAAELAQMKSTAWLINIARGRLIDDDALVAALEAKQIGGAALDVATREPLATDHPYYRLPNVILTPHVAGAFPHMNDFDRRVFLDELRRFLAGEPPQNVVHREKGY